MDARTLQPSSAALRIVLPYLAVAAMWILISDRVASAMRPEWIPEQVVQTWKGLAFVGVTSALLFSLCVRRLSAAARTERELRESERRFMAIVENLPGMAYQRLGDTEETLLFVSRGAQALTGYEPGELLQNRGVRYPELILAEDRPAVARAMRGAIEAGTPYQMEYRLRTAAGEIRWVWEQGMPVPSPEGGAVVLEGFVTDVTDRKAMERIEEHRAKLEEARRAVDEAVGAIGHELRTPLASQRLLVEAMIDGDVEEARRDECLRGVLAQTTLLTEIATNMLESARLRSEAAVWNWGPVSLAQALRSASAVMAPLAARSGVEIVSKIESPDVQMQGDADAIRRLVLNLLSNACRHTPSGRVQIGVSRSPDAASVVLEVADTGAGMSPDVLMKLGRAFALNRGAVSSDVTSGVGLGLAICRQIVAVHGGEISVVSRPGAGARFTVRMPASAAGPCHAFDPEPIRLAAA
ncbi:MAG: PAS domain-containing sensor histidine kinase [Phycisphaerales bacterium]|nr:PAS domain-containing sensor histidine kinase [Phycisphaerales bacterium]